MAWSRCSCFRLCALLCVSCDVAGAVYALWSFRWCGLLLLVASRSGSMAHASASSHFEHLRRRLGDDASDHQVRCLRRGVFCCILRVALQNYVSTFRDIAAADPEQKIQALDPAAVRFLMTSDRLVQEAVMLESHHEGHFGVQCLACSARLCVLVSVFSGTLRRCSRPTSFA